MLRTIGNNIANASKKSKTFSFAVGDGTKSVSLFNKKTGDMRSTYEVFTSINKYWGQMSKSQKTSLALTLAGKNQFEVFTSVMDNFAHAQSATTTSMNSAGSAARENAKYLESLQAKINNLKSQWQILATNVISSQFVGALLDAGEVILKFANSDMGKLVGKLLLVGTAIGGITKAAKVLKSTIGTLSGITSASSGLNVVSRTLKGGSVTGTGRISKSIGKAVGEGAGVEAGKGITTKLGTTLTKLSPLLLPVGIILGTLLGAAILKSVGDSLKKAREQKLFDNTAKISKTQSEIDTYTARSKAGDKLTESEKMRKKELEAELRILKKQTAELEKQVIDDKSGASSNLLGKSAMAQAGGVKAAYQSILDDNTKLMKQVEQQPELYSDNLKAIKKNNSAIKAQLSSEKETVKYLKKKEKSGEKLNSKEKEIIHNYNLGKKYLAAGTRQAKLLKSGVTDIGSTSKETGKKLQEAFASKKVKGAINLKDYVKSLKDAGYKAKEISDKVEKLSKNKGIKFDIKGASNVNKTIEDIAGKIKKKKITTNVKAKADTTSFKSAGTVGGSTFVKGVKSKSNEANNAGKALGNNVKTGAGSVDLSTTGNYLVQGYVQSILNGGTLAYNAGFKMAQQGVEGTKDGQVSKSPSKATAKLGNFFVQGYANSIVKGTSKSVKAAKSLAQKTVAALEMNDNATAPTYKSFKYKRKNNKKSSYKKELDKYNSYLNKYYEKGTLSGNNYYSRLDKLSKKFYNKKKISLKQYHAFQKKAVENIFDEIDTRQSQGIISGKQYYNQLTKYANKFYKKGKISYKQYRDYIYQANEALLEEYQTQLDLGNQSAQEYFNKATTLINKLYQKGKISKEKWQTLFKEIKENAISAAEEAAQKVQDKLNATLDAFSIYASEQENVYTKRNEALQSQVDVWQKEIDAIDDVNTELENQNELVELQQKLLDAKKEKVRVYSEREGWHWEQNANAVKEASDALLQYTQTTGNARRIELESNIKTVQSEMDANDALSKQWSDMVEDYSNMQQRMEWEAQNGMTIEQAVFQGRTQNLATFAENYKSTIQSLCDSIKELIELEKQLSETSTTEDSTTTKKSGNKKSKKIKTTIKAKVDSSSVGVGKLVSKANGTVALPQSSWVNYDEEGEELIVPPTSGKLGYFEKGTGIVPSDLTSNLMQLGRYGLNGIKNYVTTKVGGTSNDSSTHISISNMTVKSDDAQDFVKQLKNLAIIS